MPHEREEGGTPDIDAVTRVEVSGVQTYVVVVFELFRWGSPSQRKNSPRHYHDVAALTLRSCTHVSAFALVVYWHDPDGTPIAAY